jgi:L-alanine-DL-glutamate epimerase-like enolase superfamily enzyme
VSRAAPLRIVAAAFAPAGGSLETPFASAAGSWHDRRALRLVVRAELDAAIGLGEASPLPGYSRETLADCAGALQRFQASLPLSLPGRDASDAEVVAAIAAVASGIADKVAAARCAIETALLDLAARDRGQPLHRLLAGAAWTASAPRVALNALVADPDEARRAVDRGITCLKVKLGAVPFADDLARLTAIRAAVGPAIALRADANRAWSASDLPAILAALAPLALEYIEEPLAGGGAALAAWPDVSPVPLALDESLADPDAERWLDTALARTDLAALLLKPMLLGGLSPCLSLAARARARGVEPIVSHLVDGPIALAAAAALALALAPRRPCGLDRHAGLAAWPAVPVPAIASDAIIATDRPGLGLEVTDLVP